MNLKTLIIVFIFAVIIFFILFIIGIANKLVFYNDRIKDKFSSMKDLIDKRVDIINSIILFLEVNCPHEDNIIKKLKDIVNSIKDVDDINELLSLVYKSRGIIDNAFNLESAYIVLSDNMEYSNLKSEIKDNDDRLVFSASTYNESVDNYNSYRNNKFVNFISIVLKFGDYNKYE